MSKYVSIQNAAWYGKDAIVKEWLDSHPRHDAINSLFLHAIPSPYSTAETLKIFLSAGADPNCVETRGIAALAYTSGPPLSLAVKAKGSALEKVELLVNAGANVHYSAPHRFNAMNAAAYGNTDSIEEVIKYLIELKIDLDVVSKYGESPLSVTSNKGLFSIVKLLLNAGADPTPLEWDDLMFAIALRNIETCQELIEAGASLTARDKWSRTPFLLAIVTGDIGKAELLLQHGAKLDDTGRCGKTNLMYAVQNDGVEMLEWLISQGADVHAVDDFQTTALISAAEYGAASCTKALLKSGADLYAATHTQSFPITEAANIETVLVLKEAGGDINQISGEGYNLLMYATEARDYEFVKQLLELEADPKVSSTGEVALHKAVYADDIELIKLLLAYGSDPNTPDVDGDTPLHAVKSGEAAQVLMEAGGNPHLEDMFGATAIDGVVNEEIKSVFQGK